MKICSSAKYGSVCSLAPPYKCSVRCLPRDHVPPFPLNSASKKAKQHLLLLLLLLLFLRCYCVAIGVYTDVFVIVGAGIVIVDDGVFSHAVVIFD